MLNIDSEKLATDTIEIISGFIRVYSNFMAMAYENEHDTLTGLRNRKTFDYHLSELLSGDPSNQKPALTETKELREHQQKEHHCIGILDIDFLKHADFSR